MEIKEPWRFEKKDGNTFGTDHYFVLLKNDEYHSAYSNSELPFTTTEQMLHLVTFVLNNIAKTEDDFNQIKDKIEIFEKRKKKYINRISLCVTWAIISLLYYLKTFHDSTIIDIILGSLVGMGCVWLTTSIFELIL